MPPELVSADHQQTCQCSLFRAKRTWLDSCPAAPPEGCQMVSSKPNDAGFMYNCTFLSRDGKLIWPESMAASLTWGQSFPLGQETADGRLRHWALDGQMCCPRTSRPSDKFKGASLHTPALWGIGDYLTLLPVTVMKSRVLGAFQSKVY